jgi:lycopene beta-cyclase
MSKPFDFIITGAGCAGLTLALRMHQAGLLNNKRLAIIDPAEKNENDRTWCFWEKEIDIFETIVCKQFKALRFNSNTYHTTLNLHPYLYKMIKGIDFYNFCLSALSSSPNIVFIKEKVTAINHSSKNKTVSVTTTEGVYHGHFCFNSVLLQTPVLTKRHHYLLQHFKGWLIKTDRSFFTDQHATLMDFTVGQQHGTTFMYTMPIDDTHALVEYTLFTEKVLAPEAYETALAQYIQERLKLTNYQITHKEFGIIPMTNYKFPTQQGNILHIGTAGGWTKASSGYTFSFIQRKTAAIVNALRQGHYPTKHTTADSIRFQLYDNTLLRVLKKRTMAGDTIFAEFFKHNQPSDVLAFLSNTTSFPKEFRVMNTLPVRIFLPAAIQECWNSIWYL